MTVWSRRAFVAGAGVVAAALPAAVAGTPQSATRAVPLLCSYVAGASRRTVRAIPEELQPGAKLRLVREPANDYDQRAVAVWTANATKLGYVPRADNQALANLMDAGLYPLVEVGQVKADLSRPHIGIVISLALA